MQLPKDSCACGHLIDNHDGGRGGPCGTCGCAEGQPPSGFEAGLIHSLHELTLTLVRLGKELQAQRGVK